MDIKDFAAATPSLADAAHADRIKILGWHLHSHAGKEHFEPSDIGKCYDALHLARPLSFSGYFANLKAQKALLQSKSGYRLETKVRAKLDGLLGGREVTVQITQLLQTLPQRVPDFAERTYLDEALICYKHGAFRAAVVMAWNLAYHHLCAHVLAMHLDAFNARWVVSFPGHHKKGDKKIAAMDDFATELKESEVIKICGDARIITKDVSRILEEKLGRRNSAAHPSSVAIGKLQVDALIEDLVTNVVLKLA